MEDGLSRISHFMRTKSKPELYIFVKGATHFLFWELPEFKKYFTLVENPSPKAALLCFGPDALEEAASIPAKYRFLVTFPGFNYNPLYNLELRQQQIQLIKKYFQAVFINSGPLEIAYKGVPNVYFYPFSVDTNLVGYKKYRNRINTLLHVSNNGPQKDWERSEKIMKLTRLKYEVFPPRDNNILEKHIKKNERKNRLRRIMRISQKEYLPLGYVDHELVIKKYQQYDGFVHVARDIKHKGLIDGKYTASLIEAGITGAILFWHDTLKLGNSLETVFDLPLNESKAAAEIIDIKNSIDVEKHSKRTREEMLDTFNPEKSVRIRAEKILEYL